ncbi:hypothetical protein CH373_07835 [Leptospira perolatii]|uniref:Uncharacterized protein n=1 Tax=Leptospira perolatii TaxID=2023191 RepID=A0A2M9ZN09_9LEPT|nr:hypothetical protein CH360_13880 [Leptospira perolatii]PJZ73425.1 hypothetical protein CH373_07835 [Leptospira perolatii]
MDLPTGSVGPNAYEERILFVCHIYSENIYSEVCSIRPDGSDFQKHTNGKYYWILDILPSKEKNTLFLRSESTELIDPELIDSQDFLAQNFEPEFKGWKFTFEIERFRIQDGQWLGETVCLESGYSPDPWLTGLTSSLCGNAPGIDQTRNQGRSLLLDNSSSSLDLYTYNNYYSDSESPIPILSNINKNNNYLINQLPAWTSPEGNFFAIPIACVLCSDLDNGRKPFLGYSFLNRDRNQVLTTEMVKKNTESVYQSGYRPFVIWSPDEKSVLVVNYEAVEDYDNSTRQNAANFRITNLESGQEREILRITSDSDFYVPFLDERTILWTEIPK